MKICSSTIDASIVVLTGVWARMSLIEFKQQNPNSTYVLSFPYRLYSFQRIFHNLLCQLGLAYFLYFALRMALDVSRNACNS